MFTEKLMNIKIERIADTSNILFNYDAIVLFIVYSISLYVIGIDLNIHPHLVFITKDALILPDHTSTPQSAVLCLCYRTACIYCVAAQQPLM